MLKGLLALCLLAVVLGEWDLHWDNLCVKGTLPTVGIDRQLRKVSMWTHPDKGHPAEWFINATRARDALVDCRGRNLGCGRVDAYEPRVYCQPKDEPIPDVVPEPMSQSDSLLNVTLVVVFALLFLCANWKNPTPPNVIFTPKLDTQYGGSLVPTQKWFDQEAKKQQVKKQEEDKKIRLALQSSGCSARNPILIS